MQQSQSPGVTIVNGAPAASASSSPSVPASTSQPDHARKPSVTITSAGTSGYIPNGGPSSRPNSLQFGFANQQTSPSMGPPAALSGPPQSGLGVAATANPRITSPQTSPSPIPQPASSGGRPPPSSYQSQGNVPNFGSFGEAGDNVSFFFFLFFSFFWSCPFLVVILHLAYLRFYFYLIFTTCYLWVIRTGCDVICVSLRSFPAVNDLVRRTQRTIGAGRPKEKRPEKIYGPDRVLALCSFVSCLFFMIYPSLFFFFF